MKDDITVEETIKNVIEICLDRKKIKGTIKEGCIIDDTVILSDGVNKPLVDVIKTRLLEIGIS